MEEPQKPTQETHRPFPWKKAIKNTLLAMVVGVATGLIGGLILPGIAESLAGTLLPSTAPAVFQNFPPSVMGLFFGVTSGISTFLTVTLENAVDAPSLVRKEIVNRSDSEQNEDMSPALNISHGASLPIAAHGMDGSSIPHLPVHFERADLPTTAIMEAVHESRLQASPQIGTLKIH